VHDEIFSFWEKQIELAKKTMLNNQLFSKVGNAKFSIFDIDRQNTAKIKQFCKENNLTYVNFFIAVSFLLIYKLKKIKDITIGLTMSTRNNYCEFDAIGSFVDQGLFSLCLSDNMEFKKICSAINTLLHQYFKYRVFPIEYFKYNDTEHYNKDEFNRILSIILNYWESMEQNIYIDNKLVLRRIILDNPSPTSIRAFSVNIYEQEQSFHVNLRYKDEFFRRSPGHIQNEFYTILDDVLI